MSIPVVVVDPFAKTVERIELEPGRSWLDQIREIVGCTVLTTMKPSRSVVLWLDSMGLLQGPGQRFWRERGSALRIAGRAVVTSVDPDGMTMPWMADLDAVRATIDWCENDRIVRVFEEIHIEHHPELGPWPRVLPQVEFAGEEPTLAVLAPAGEETPPAAVPGASEAIPERTYWVVYEDDEQDDYVARERAITGNEGEEGRYTGNEERFESLDDVKAFAAREDRAFILRSKSDPEGIAGTVI